MKFARRIPQGDKKISEELLEDGWKRLKEPKNLESCMLASVPIMIIGGFISNFIVTRFYNPIGKILQERAFSFTINFLDIIYFIAAMFVVVIIHELLHAIFIPNFAESDKTFFGITLFGAFVYTTEKIEKSRFIIISVMPFMMISIVFPIILGAFNGFNGIIMFLVILNAAASSVDILNLFLILFQVPKEGYIVSNGFETYFR